MKPLVYTRRFRQGKKVSYLCTCSWQPSIPQTFFHKSVGSRETAVYCCLPIVWPIHLGFGIGLDLQKSDNYSDSHVENGKHVANLGYKTSCTFCVPLKQAKVSEMRTNDGKLIGGHLRMTTESKNDGHVTVKLKLQFRM